MIPLDKTKSPQLDKVHAGKVRDSFRLSPSERLVVVTDGDAGTDQTAVVATAISCKLCAAGFYASGNTCVAAVGSAVANCAVYASATLCSICSNGFYYNSAANTCVAVTAAIANCVRYSAAATCAECAAGFFLANNSCAKVVALVDGCDAYDQNKQCLMCVPGKLLTNQTCAALPANATANCSQFYANNSCAACNSGFFPDSNNVCQSVGGLISNCSAYSAPF